MAGGTGPHSLLTTGVAKPEEVELSRATFPDTSCAVGTQVAEAATCATQRRKLSSTAADDAIGFRCVKATVR